MKTLALAAALSFSAMAAPGPASAGSGIWDLTMTMTGEGAGSHVIKVSKCLCSHDVIRIDDDAKCSVTYKVVSGDTVRWAERCRDGVESKGMLVYDGEAVNGEMTLSVMDANSRPDRINQRIEGRRTGRCR